MGFILLAHGSEWCMIVHPEIIQQWYGSREMPPGSGSAELFAYPGSGRTFQSPNEDKHFGVPDPDPHKNFENPKHCWKVDLLLPCLFLKPRRRALSGRVGRGHRWTLVSCRYCQHLQYKYALTTISLVIKNINAEKNELLQLRMVLNTNWALM